MTRRSLEEVLVAVPRKRGRKERRQTWLGLSATEAEALLPRVQAHADQLAEAASQLAPTHPRAAFALASVALEEYGKVTGLCARSYDLMPEAAWAEVAPDLAEHSGKVTGAHGLLASGATAGATADLLLDGAQGHEEIAEALFSDRVRGMLPAVAQTVGENIAGAPKWPDIREAALYMDAPDAPTLSDEDWTVLYEAVATALDSDRRLLGLLRNPYLVQATRDHRAMFEALVARATEAALTGFQGATATPPNAGQSETH